MKTRIALPALVLALASAGCAQTVDGSPATTFPTSIQALAAKIQSGTQSLRTAHVTMRVSLAGQSIDASGDEQASNGKATALSLDERIPEFGAVRVIRVDDKTYVRLPAAHRLSDKPWALVRADSSNPVVSAMAASLGTTDQLTQLDAVDTFVHAARNLHLVGTDTIDGVTVGHYTLTIDVDRLPADFPQKQTLETAGLNALPANIWVDADGHSRKVTENLTVVGQKISVVIELGDFDKPVHITAPPASQVDTS